MRVVLARRASGSSRSGVPRTTTRFPPRCWSDSRRSFRQANRKASRLAAAEQPLVEHEHGDDALARVQRRPQRRVIVDAQVAPEPDEGRRPSHRVRSARLRLDRGGAGPGFPAVPARARRPAERARPAAHLRGALQDDDRALPGGGVRVRDRLARRRRAAADRLRVRGRRGARADARRAAEPRRARHAAVPDRGAPGRARLPGGRRRVPRRPRRGDRLRGRRGRPQRLHRPRRAGHRQARPTRTRSTR